MPAAKRQDYAGVMVYQPTCPFCGLPVTRPVEQSSHRPNEMPVGACSCGAVYAADISGHNLGAAFIEALVFGCNGDWDLAWGLLPGEDYLEKIVANYDYETHLLVPGGTYAGRRICGALYFVKLQEDILEVTGPGIKKRLVSARETTGKLRPEAGETPSGIVPGTTPDSLPATPAASITVSSGVAAAGVSGKRLSSQEVKAMVASYTVEPLLARAISDHRLVRDLQRLLCSGDELLRMRAADILGQVAAVIARRDPGFVARLLQGLLTSVTDPGASSWGALDAAAAIITSAPAAFAGYIPAIYALLATKNTRPLAMRALASIATIRPDLLQRYGFHILPYLADPDAATRGYAACLLGSLRVAGAREALQALVGDEQTVNLYCNGTLVKKTVGELAAAALG